jgi:hypothetical protein
VFPGAGPYVIEKRIYAKEGVLPSWELLVRSGVQRVSIHHSPRGAEYVMRFDTLESRARAWDRFNSDPEWCALRTQGSVQLLEMSIAG